MKKTTYLFKGLGALALAFSAFALPSCLGDGDETMILESDRTPLINNLFSIDGADFQKGEMPPSTTDATIGTVVGNTQALAGGMNFVTVTSPTPYDKFYVGVRGMGGYWVVPVEGSYNSSTRLYTYKIPVMYSEGYNLDIDMIIRGVGKGTGEVSQPAEIHVEYVESRSGELNVNLTFDNEKDVDLHLVTPSGKHIYYGDRGAFATNEKGENVQVYGLDHDSNAGCSIDGLNNENIFLPVDMIEAGTYTVGVALYSNCTPHSNPTNWSVAVRYRGALVSNELSAYGNPASGTYATNASSQGNNYVPVVRFTLTAVEAAVKKVRALQRELRPIPLTDMDIVKMEQAYLDGLSD